MVDSTNNPAVALVQTSDRNINQLQQNLVQRLNQIKSNKILQNNFLQSIQLAIGTNNINHLLGRPLVGWSIIRKRGNANIYDTQDSNTSPAVTLSLVSDAAVSIDLMVF